MDFPPKPCKECREAFLPKNDWQKFCSKLCHNLWHKRELKEAKAALAEKRGESFSYLLSGIESKGPDVTDL